MNTKHTLAIMGGIIIIAGGYWGFSVGGSAANTTTATEVATPSVPETNTTAMTETTTATPSSEPTTVTTPTEAASTSLYKDGTFTATGNYNTPEGPEKIGVTLTLKDGIITDASLTQEGMRHESVEFQAIFAGSYKQYVVGKSITDLKLGKISRSSLTPIGFNAALATIKAEAKA